MDIFQIQQFKRREVLSHEVGITMESCGEKEDVQAVTMYSQVYDPLQVLYFI